MENKSKNAVGENNLKDEIFTVKDNNYVVDKNGVIWEDCGDNHFSVFVMITKNENDKCYELNALQGDEHKEKKYIGKIYFSQLWEKKKLQIENLMKTTKKDSLDLRLICVADNGNYTDLHFRKKQIKYKHCLYLANDNLYQDKFSWSFEQLFDPYRTKSYTPILDRLYLRMFFPEIDEREKRIDKKNDHIELNFYSERKKILLGEGLAYIILLAASVVAMVFSLINLMIFIIVTAILTTIFGIGSLYEFKFRKIPYVSELPQEEIGEIKKQIEAEKNKNKDQDQNKDNKDDKKKEDENLMEINTDSHKGNKESLVEKIENVSKDNKKQEDNKDKLGVFSFIDTNKNNDDDKKNKTDPTDREKK